MNLPLLAYRLHNSLIINNLCRIKTLLVLIIFLETKFCIFFSIKKKYDYRNSIFAALCLFYLLKFYTF